MFKLRAFFDTFCGRLQWGTSSPVPIGPSPRSARPSSILNAWSAVDGKGPLRALGGTRAGSEGLARQQEEKELRRYNSFQARAGRTARTIVIGACIVAFATAAILTVYFAIANYGFLVGISSASRLSLWNSC